MDPRLFFSIFFLWDNFMISPPDCNICHKTISAKHSDYRGHVSHEALHAFHEKCIKKWIAVSGNAPCPVCRQVTNFLTFSNPFFDPFYKNKYTYTDRVRKSIKVIHLQAEELGEALKVKAMKLSPYALVFGMEFLFYAGCANTIGKFAPKFATGMLEGSFSIACASAVSFIPINRKTVYSIALLVSLYISHFWEIEDPSEAVGEIFGAVAVASACDAISKVIRVFPFSENERPTVEPFFNHAPPLHHDSSVGDILGVNNLETLMGNTVLSAAIALGGLAGTTGAAALMHVSPIKPTSLTSVISCVAGGIFGATATYLGESISTFTAIAFIIRLKRSFDY